MLPPVVFSGPIAPAFSTLTVTSRLPAFSKTRVNGNDWPGRSWSVKPISMMCIAPGSSLIG